MKKFNVVFSYAVTVEAEDDAEAEEKALTIVNDMLMSEAYYDIEEAKEDDNA